MPCPFITHRKVYTLLGPQKSRNTKLLFCCRRFAFWVSWPGLERKVEALANSWLFSTFRGLWPDLLKDDGRAVPQATVFEWHSQGLGLVSPVAAFAVWKVCLRCDEASLLWGQKNPSTQMPPGCQPGPQRRWGAGMKCGLIMASFLTAPSPVNSGVAVRWQPHAGGVVQAAPQTARPLRRGCVPEGHCQSVCAPPEMVSYAFCSVWASCFRLRRNLADLDLEMCGPHFMS